MIPVTTRDQTKSFVKPEKWDEAEDGRCGALSVRIEHIGRRSYHYSTWRPTADERAHLAAGACVELCCVGSQPPVALRTTERQPVTADRRAQLAGRLNALVIEALDKRVLGDDIGTEQAADDILILLGAA